MPPLAHARASASGAHRWTHCTASVKAESCFPEGSTLYAEEGTLAHALAEDLIVIGGPGHDRKPEIEAFYSEHPDMGSYTEMRGYLEPYVEFVEDEYKAASHIDAGAVRLTETRVDLTKWIPEGFGTTDVAIVADGTLEIIDLKYGKGVPVSAKDNPQLRLYALGTLELLSEVYDIEKVKMVIYQPRLDNVSIDTTTAEELITWGDLVIKPAAEEALSDDGKFKPGEWCQFCKARNECRARAEMYTALKDFKDKAFLSNNEIADILGYIDGLVKWADGLKENALSRALEGEEFRGWKVVEGRSNRKYAVADTEIAKACTAAGYDEALIWERKLLTLSAMEKLMGKKDFEKVLGNMVEKPQGKPTLAPESDKRPSLIATAADDFADEL